VPFGDDFEERIEQALPDKTEPAVVNCFDADCNASPILVPERYHPCERVLYGFSSV
jgi:hypothetical protein